MTKKPQCPQCKTYNGLYKCLTCMKIRCHYCGMGSRCKDCMIDEDEAIEQALYLEDKYGRQRYAI